MTSSINKLITMLVLVVTFTSCDQNPSLQTYFVDNELKPGFTSIDIPTSLLNIEQTVLTEEQKEELEKQKKQAAEIRMDWDNCVGRKRH